MKQNATFMQLETEMKEKQNPIVFIRFGFRFLNFFVIWTHAGLHFNGIFKKKKKKKKRKRKKEKK